MKEAFKKMLEQRIANIPKREDIPPYNCAKCRDLLYTFNTQGQAVPCECKNKVESLEKLNKCGLEEAFKKMTFDNYEVVSEKQIKAKLKAIDYCRNFKNTNASLLITGRPGAGKTHLASAAMLKLIEQNIACKYELYTDMLINLKQSVMDEENHIREKEKYYNPRVLFLDDFLKGKPTEADFKQIFALINHRYKVDKPMIISTELSLNQIIQWDEAIGSRINQMCKGYVIEFGRDVNNYRLRK